MDQPKPDNQLRGTTAPDERIEISSVAPSQPEQEIKPEEEPQEQKILKDCFDLLENAKTIRQERLTKLQERTTHLEHGIEDRLTKEPQDTINELGRIKFESSGVGIGLKTISEIKALILKTEENIEGSINEKVESLGTSKEQLITGFQKNIVPNIKSVLELFISFLEKEEEKYLLDPTNQNEITRRLLVRQTFVKDPKLQKIIAENPELKLILTGGLEKPADIGTTQPQRETLPETPEGEINTLDQQEEATDRDIKETTKALEKLRNEEARSSTEQQELKAKKDGLETQAQTTKEEFDRSFPPSKKQEQ